jgi:hypothetical protein
MDKLVMSDDDTPDFPYLIIMITLNADYDTPDLYHIPAKIQIKIHSL